MPLDLKYPVIFNTMLPEDLEPFPKDFLPSKSEVRGLTGRLEDLIQAIGGFSWMFDEEPSIRPLFAYGTVVDGEKALNVCLSGLMTSEQLELCRDYYDAQTYLAPVTASVMAAFCEISANYLKEGKNPFKDKLT